MFSEQEALAPRSLHARALVRLLNPRVVTPGGGSSLSTEVVGTEVVSIVTKPPVDYNGETS